MAGSRLAFVLRDFADYDAETYFEAALALYLLRVEARILQKHLLSVIGRFLLRTIALGRNTLEDISHLLGMDEEDLAIAAEELLRGNLIVQGPPGADGRRRLFLTGPGTVQLAENKSLMVPRKRTLRFHFDPLTNRLLPRERSAVQNDEVRKEGLYVIGGRGPRPTLGDISLKDVQETLAADGEDDNEVIALLNLKDPYLEYLRGLDVYVLRHRQTQEQRFAVYRGIQYLPTESESVQRLAESGAKVVPADATSMAEPRLDVDTFLPHPSAEATRAVVQQDAVVDDLQRQIAVQQEARSATQDRAERAALQQRIEELTIRLATAEEQRTLLERRLAEESRNTAQVLRTEDHRAVLERAFREAEQRILLISPWMRTSAVNRDLCALIVQTLERGVRITIGYGYAFEKDGAEAERNRQSAQAVIDRVRKETRHIRDNSVDFRDIGGTHEKVLVVDDAYAVATSFNWLSYRGDRDTEFRRETGLLTRDPETVRMLATRALEELGQPAQPVAPKPQQAQPPRTATPAPTPAAPRPADPLPPARAEPAPPGPVLSMGSPSVGATLKGHVTQVFEVDGWVEVEAGSQTVRVPITELIDYRRADPPERRLEKLQRLKGQAVEVSVISTDGAGVTICSERRASEARRAAQASVRR